MNTLTLRIGRRTWQVGSYTEAVEIYCNYRDGTGYGADEMPSGIVGAYHVSYNGRLWKGPPRAWKAGDEPVSPAELDAAREVA